MRRHNTSILTISLKKNRQKVNKVMGLLVLVTVRFKVKQSRAKEELHGREGGETKSKGLTVLLECHLVITVRSISVKSKHVLLIQIIKTKIGVPMIFSKYKN